MKKKPTLSDREQAAFHAGCVVGHAVKCFEAAARTTSGKVVFVAILLAIIFSLSGCNTSPHKLTPVIEAAPVILSQGTKDTTILREADSIDAITPQAKPHTDAQRAAVAAAPAENVAKLASGYEAKLKELTNRIADLGKTIEDLKDAEQKKQVATLRWIGLGALAIAGLLAWAQQIRFAAVGALVGLVSLGLAQLISQPWFMPAVAVASGIALLALGWAAWHAYQKGTLARKVELESERLKGALTKIVPAVDSSLGALDAATRTVIETALSRAMDEDHKKLIKEIRAKL
jgi:hypothetical protein